MTAKLICIMWLGGGLRFGCCAGVRGGGCAAAGVCRMEGLLYFRENRVLGMYYYDYLYILIICLMLSINCSKRGRRRFGFRRILKIQMSKGRYSGISIGVCLVLSN